MSLKDAMFLQSSVRTSVRICKTNCEFCTETFSGFRCIVRIQKRTICSLGAAWDGGKSVGGESESQVGHRVRSPRSVDDPARVATRHVPLRTETSLSPAMNSSPDYSSRPVAPYLVMKTVLLLDENCLNTEDYSDSRFKLCFY
jgi:hypothetical protein